MDGLSLSVFAGCAAIVAGLPTWLTTERLVVVVIPLATLALVLVFDALDKRAARRMKAAALAAQPAPKWAIALLVDADEKSGILRPSVQVFGPRLASDILVDLRVGDEHGEVRLTTERRFSAPATKNDLVLGTLTLPDGVPAAQAALWDWTVVLSNDGHEIARRCGPLTASGLVNDEGELQAPDLEPVPEEVELPGLTPDPVRRLRWTIGFLCATDGIAIGGYLLTTLTAWLWFAAVPLFLLAGLLLVAAGILLHAACPICGRTTTVVRRTGTQRCDACRGDFTLTPGPL
jgi:hypothetical protein